MTDVAALRAEWLAARDTASAAYQSIYGPARERNEQAMAEARAAGVKKITNDERDDYSGALAAAGARWHAIVDGPEAALNAALAEAEGATP